MAGVGSTARIVGGRLCVRMTVSGDTAEIVGALASANTARFVTIVRNVGGQTYALMVASDEFARSVWVRHCVSTVVCSACARIVVERGFVCTDDSDTTVKSAGESGSASTERRKNAVKNVGGVNGASTNVFDISAKSAEEVKSARTIESAQFAKIVRVLRAVSTAV
mmetsp:Transcript_22075/g.43801  ORF Transcript_22075/g.43801 Transcript_22075/m.43801 type:complete len:166 (-) Transcript_22075:99-596(-)